MEKLDRRTFLCRSVLLGGALLGVEGLVARGALAASEVRLEPAPQGEGGYGPLFPTRTENTGEVLLALPAGFQYTVFGKIGGRMSDGNTTPGFHDGMAAFDIGGEIRLVRNHEFRGPAGLPGALVGNAAAAYDTRAGGGTTTLVVDSQTRGLVRDWVSLGGTHTNCAGGPTPWNTWISCEETTQRRDWWYRKNHGYCFEVAAAANGQTVPVPLRAMGRFVHEAVAVDPVTGIVYQTEDRSTAGFYRFVPAQPGNLGAGGRLQMLAVAGQPRYDTRTGQQTGAPRFATWVDIPDPDPAAAGNDAQAVYKQGLASGGATFARLEGCWHGNSNIYVNATSGGDRGRGQVWQYTPDGAGDGVLTLLFESPDPAVLDAPDNLCVSPRGGLVLCEDGDGVDNLRGLTPQGQTFEFARNAIPLVGSSEFAGATFSPDGQTLFVNMQLPGLTFAIWGPWEEGAL